MTFPSRTMPDNDLRRRLERLLPLILMVAVLQNSSRRGERAVQAKLDAIADALADFMDKADIELADDVRELEEAVGLEERLGSR